MANDPIGSYANGQPRKVSEYVLTRVENIIPSSPASNMTAWDVAKSVGISIHQAQSALTFLVRSGRIAYRKSNFQNARYYFRGPDGKTP